MNHSIEQLLTIHKRSLESLAFHLSKDAQTAKDIFQETVCLIWANKDNFQQGTNFWAWSRTIMCNYFRSSCSNRRRRQQLLAVTGSLDYLYCHTERNINHGDWMLFFAEVEAKLNQLDAALHIPLMMIYEGYSYEETSDLLGVKLNTLKSRIRQGREKMREAIPEATLRGVQTSTIRSALLPSGA